MLLQFSYLPASWEAIKELLGKTNCVEMMEHFFALLPRY